MPGMEPRRRAGSRCRIARSKKTNPERIAVNASGDWASGTRAQQEDPGSDGSRCRRVGAGGRQPSSQRGQPAAQLGLQDASEAFMGGPLDREGQAPASARGLAENGRTSSSFSPAAALGGRQVCLSRRQVCALHWTATGALPSRHWQASRLVLERGFEL